MIPYSCTYYGEIRSADAENGQWQENPLYLVSISKIVTLPTIPITQILPGNKKIRNEKLK